MKQRLEIDNESKIGDTHEDKESRGGGKVGAASAMHPAPSRPAPLTQGASSHHVHQPRSLPPSDTLLTQASAGANCVTAARRPTHAAAASTPHMVRGCCCDSG